VRGAERPGPWMELGVTTPEVEWGAPVCGVLRAGARTEPVEVREVCLELIESDWLTRESEFGVDYPVHNFRVHRRELIRKAFRLSPHEVQEYPFRIPVPSRARPDQQWSVHPSALRDRLALQYSGGQFTVLPWLPIQRLLRALGDSTALIPRSWSFRSNLVAIKLRLPSAAQGPFKSALIEMLHQRDVLNGTLVVEPAGSLLAEIPRALTGVARRSLPFSIREDERDFRAAVDRVLRPYSVHMKDAPIPAEAPRQASETLPRAASPSPGCETLPRASGAPER
jgi:hypothetical protein